MRVDGPFVNICKSKNFFTVMILLIVNIIFGLTVIYVKHKNRTLHMKLQQIARERAELNLEWNKLLLEKSNSLSEYKIEKLAKKKLDMIEPEQIYIIR